MSDHNNEKLNELIARFCYELEDKRATGKSLYEVQKHASQLFGSIVYVAVWGEHGNRKWCDTGDHVSPTYKAFYALYEQLGSIETPQQFWNAMDAIHVLLSPGFSPNEAREVQLGWVNPDWSAANCPAQYQWEQVVAERLGDIFRARAKDAMGVLRALPAPPKTPERKAACEQKIPSAPVKAGKEIVPDDSTDDENLAGMTPPPLNLAEPPKTPERKASPVQLPPAPIKAGKTILAHTGDTTEEDEPMPVSPRGRRARSRSRSRSRSPVLVQPRPRRFDRFDIRNAVRAQLERERVDPELADAVNASLDAFAPSELIMPRSSMSAVRAAAVNAMQLEKEMQQAVSLIDLTSD